MSKTPNDPYDFLKKIDKAIRKELEAEDPDESANEEIDLGEEAVELMIRPMIMLESYDYKHDR